MIKEFLHQKQTLYFVMKVTRHDGEGFHVNTSTFIFLPPFALQIVHPLSKLNGNSAGAF